MPAPEGKLALELGGDGPEGIIRRAAMNALTSVRGQEAPTFQALAKFVRDDVDRHAAVLALQRIPAAYWPTEEAGPLLESLIAYVRKVPVAGPDLARGARRAAARRRPGRAPARRPRPQAVRKELRRAGRPRDPRRHGARADALRQGPDRRPGRQAGRDRVREHRPDAAQLRGHAARRARGGRPPGRGDGHQPDAARAAVRARARPRSCFASRLLQPREVAEARLHRPDAGRASIPTSAPIPATGGGCTGRSTSSTTSTSYLADPEAYLAGHPAADRRRAAQVDPPAHGVEVRRPGRVGRPARHRPLVRQRQADVPGRHLRRLPPDGGARATSSART